MEGKVEGEYMKEKKKKKKDHEMVSVLVEGGVMIWVIGELGLVLVRGKVVVVVVVVVGR